KLAEAERLYAAILQVRPDNIDALQMMALTKLAHGQPAVALRLMSSAMQARKPSPQILLNYGLILNALQRHGEAIESFDQAIKQKSKFAEAHNNRGATLSTVGHQARLRRGALQSRHRAARARPLRRGAQELRPRAGAAAQAQRGAQQSRRGARSARQIERRVGLLR